MKKKIIVISSIIIGCLLLFLFFSSLFFFFKVKKLKNENTQIIKKYDGIVKEYKEENNQLKKDFEEMKKENEKLSEEQINTIPCEDLRVKYLKLQNYTTNLENLYSKSLEDKEKIIGDVDLLNRQLDKINDMLSSLYKPYGFGLYAMGGFTNVLSYKSINNLSFDLIIGADFAFSFLYNRIILLIGGYVKPLEDLGFGAKSEIIFMFGKKK